MARRTVWFERRFWCECGAFYGLLLCWMYADPTSGVSRYLPPKLDITASYIDIAVNSTLRITCYGMYPVAWALPSLASNVSLRSSISEEWMGDLTFKSVFELNTTDVMDQGHYTCYYTESTNLTNTANATSTYVFVNDDNYLFMPQKHMDKPVLLNVRFGELLVVPCLPTHSGAKVQIWKDLGQGEMEEVSLASPLVEFDTTRGFIIYRARNYYTGHFMCNGSVPGRIYKDSSMSVVFVYAPHVDKPAGRFFDITQMLKESFTLSCTVTVEEGAMVVMSWDYPNKNSSRIEVKKPVRQNKTFGQERFILSVVTSQLTVRDMQWSDEGWYTCSCRDHGGKTNNDSVFIHVKAKPVVTVVNHTELFAYGANFTLVCTVRGSKPLDAWWEWLKCVEPRTCFEQRIYTAFKPLTARSHHVNVPGDGTLVQMADSIRHVNVTLRLRAKQSGLYRCVGSNSVGMSSSVIKFYVTDVKNSLEIIASDVMPLDQDKVRLSCLANKFEYENLTWRWKAKGSPDYFSLNVSDALQINISSTAFSNNLTLYFNPIGRNQSGLYECIGATRGENTHRHIEFVNIAVRDMRPPEFSANTTLRNNEVSAVPYLLLYCSANGVPEPTISWFKDGKPLNMTGPSLTKEEVTPPDNGFYQCRAENRAGATYANITINAASGVLAHGKSSTQVTWMTVGFTVFGICILVTLFFICKQYGAVKRKEENEMELLNKTLFDECQVDMFNPDLPLCEQVELLPYNERWEFPRDRLKLGRTLGQGAFGRVVKAEAIGLGPNGQSLTVAVKMLKEGADMPQRKALIAELKILIHLGRHLNIVNILGAVTKNVAKGELMVIVEYCKFGNLRHYLLRHRGRFINQLNPETGRVDPDICYSPKSPTSPSPGFRQQRHASTLKYADLAMSANPSSHGNEFSSPVSKSGSTTDGFQPESGNHAPLMSGSSPRDHGDPRDAALTTCNLLCFAFQCTRGMEYLASRKLIRRDLAARNVLVSGENVVKICDFGLAKDCYKYSNYVMKGDGLLPVKWTAIESIMDRVFTTKSDVWSYGVLLWEMFSLGRNPYPGVVIDESFYKRLENGYRMEKPEYAPDDVYEIMQSCWQAEPKNRPEFSTLVTRLGDLLQAGVRDYYMTLNDPYADANHLMKNNDYLAMGNNSPSPDYLDMKSDDKNFINTSLASIQTCSEPNYASLAITNTTVSNGSAIASDGIQMMPILGHGGDTHEDDMTTEPSNMNVNGPTLKMCLPAGKRRCPPPRLLPQPGAATGDARASDDLSEMCAMPSLVPDLSVIVDGSGGTEV